MQVTEQANIIRFNLEALERLQRSGHPQPHIEGDTPFLIFALKMAKFREEFSQDWELLIYQEFFTEEERETFEHGRNMPDLSDAYAYVCRQINNYDRNLN